jgi:hypothetical protein
MLMTGPPVKKKYLRTILIIPTLALPHPNMMKCLYFMETRERGNCTWRNRYKPGENGKIELYKKQVTFEKHPVEASEMKEESEDPTCTIDLVKYREEILSKFYEEETN